MRLRDSILGAFAVITLTSTAALAGTGFSCLLTGSAEVPANASEATGSCTAVLNNAGTQVIFSVAFQNLGSSYTASHFHAAASSVANAGVTFGFSGVAAGWILTNANKDGTLTNAVWNLSATQKTNLLAGLTYVNILSSGLPGGEVRGQLIQDQSVPTRNTSWGRMKALYR